MKTFAVPKIMYRASVIPLSKELIELIEDQIKEGQSLGLTCASRQDVNNLFDDNLPQLLFASAGSPASRIDSGRRITHCGDLDGRKVCSLILTFRNSITLITFSFNTIPNNDISLNVSLFSNLRLTLFMIF